MKMSAIVVGILLLVMVLNLVGMLLARRIIAWVRIDRFRSWLDLHHFAGRLRRRRRGHLGAQSRLISSDPVIFSLEAL